MSNYVFVRPLWLGDGFVLMWRFPTTWVSSSEVCLHTPVKILSLKVRTNYIVSKMSRLIMLGPDPPHLTRVVEVIMESNLW